MALHTTLPIYATGGKLLTLTIRIQVQLPRAVKRVLGDQVTTHCIDMLNAMALANASMRPADRTRHIERVLEIQRAVQVLLRVCFDESNHEPKRQHQARRLRHADLCALEVNDAALHQSEGRELRALRRSRHRGLRALAGLPIISHRYGRVPRPRDDARPYQERPRLRARQLPLGDARGAEPQPTESRRDAHTRRRHAQPDRLGAIRRHAAQHAAHAAADRLDASAGADDASRMQALSADEFDQVNSYFGLLRQSPASHHLRARLANAARDRGFTVNASFTKAFRKAATPGDL